ncbi:hypothetical protein AKJ09_06334 [Labilithrix luteola]|uniref:IgGFc-binding protein N-terminal domain-containing protein n=1 Tax=Labilithrix luteola TaxID=1391654 RepID=A0A0K1Q1K2_9BACT|nr:IgGFc-binding protein [Labilithrix luteola]AKU99670.1 hypothetical protein AKJ09_06334 [Labilithrix luteola]
MSSSAFLGRTALRSRVALSCVGGLVTAIVAFAAGACGESRNSFVPPSDTFGEAGADAGDCQFQCSLDGRSVVRACTGEIVETCPPDLACGGARCQEPCAAAADDRTSNGCEYYLQTPRLDKVFQQSCLAAFLVNTSTLPVDVSLDLDGQPLDLSKSMFLTHPGDATLLPHSGPIAPGESVILFVSDRDPDQNVPPGTEGEVIGCPKEAVAASHSDPLPNRTGIGRAFHMTTNRPVGASTIYPFGGARSYLPAATLLLPVATWSKEHVLIDGWSRSEAGRPGAQIVASADDTVVTINPTQDIQDGTGVKGTAARLPATYHLDKGQVLQFVQDAELTGSIVTSTKPTTIFGGNSCALIPIDGAACDYLHQQIPAFEQWGSEYVGVGYRPRLDNEHEPVPYRIVAARDGTRLEYDPVIPPGAPTTLSAGEMATFASGTGDAFVVRSQDGEHPIYLASYMTGGDMDYYGSAGFGGKGDPEFINVIPAGQYLNSYSFYADPTYAETSLVIVRAKAKDRFEDVWLECAGNLTDWRPVDAKGKYEFTRVDLMRSHGHGQEFDGGVCQSGLQRMRSDGPFTATLWGWDAYASYGYPGGMAQRRLVTSPLVPVQ